MASLIEWHRIYEGTTVLGAVGFLGRSHEPIALGTFFDDDDGNLDGEVDAGEWTASFLWDSEGRALATTAAASISTAYNYKTALRGGYRLRQWAGQIITDVGRKMVAQGFEYAYIKPVASGVGGVAGSLAKIAGLNMVKSMVLQQSARALANSGLKSVFKL